MKQTITNINALLAPRIVKFMIDCAQSGAPVRNNKQMKIDVVGYIRAVFGSVTVAAIICCAFAMLALVSPANAQTTLDTAFNPDANARVWTTAVQPDGKIIIGGLFTTVGGVTRNRIARVNADGSLDTAFNPDVGGSSSSVLAIAVQPDGKIIIGGFFTAVSGVTRNFIARLNADGSLDTLSTLMLMASLVRFSRPSAERNQYTFQP